MTPKKVWEDPNVMEIIGGDGTVYDRNDIINAGGSDTSAWIIQKVGPGMAVIDGVLVPFDAEGNLLG